MLLYLLGYFGIGIIAIFVVSLIHVTTAIRRGYDIDIINKIVWDINKESGTPDRFVLGWIIWPIRLMQFIRDMDSLYEAYDQFESESN